MEPVNPTSNNNSTSGEMSKEDIIDFLNVDDGNGDGNDKPDDSKSNDDGALKLDINAKPDERDDEDKADDEDSNDDKDLDKLKVEDEKFDDESSFDDVPDRKVILKEYPDIFKKFPGLQHAMYRDKAYSEIFPTVADAKKAQQRSEDMSKFEGELFEGNIDGVFKSLKKTDPDAFDKLGVNLLGTLQKVDNDLYIHTCNRVVKNMLMVAERVAKDDNDEQLGIAAQLLHKFIYKSTKITPLEEYKNTGRTDEVSPREKLVAEREKSLAEKEFNTARNEVISGVGGIIDKTIGKYIDPRQKMPEYVREKATQDVKTRLEKAVGEDGRFRSILDQLWRKASESGYTKETKGKIRDAIINKASSLLPEIIRSVRADATRGMTIRNNKSKDDDDILSDRKSGDKDNTSRNRPKGNDKVNDGKVPRGMKSLDFLNS